MECLGLTAGFRPANDEKFSNLQAGRSNSLGSSLPCCRRCSLYVRFFDACTSKSLCAPIFFLSLSLSLSPSISLSRLHPFASLIALVSSAPLRGPTTHITPVFSSRTSSFFRAGLRVCVVQSLRKVFVWRFRREMPFLSLQSIPLFLSVRLYPRGRSLSSLREHPGAWTRNEIFWRIPFRICVCVCVFARARARTHVCSSVAEKRR